MFADRILTCTDCGSEFVFSAGEQAFFQQRGFDNAPKRCKQCNANRKAGAAGSGRPRSADKTPTAVVCASCGAETTVPFKPRTGRPVLCRPCFQATAPARG